MSLGAAMAATAAFTLLNPHVYIGTMMLVGAVGASLPALERPGFMAGAVLASVVWFMSLGFGARFLAPVFARPIAWRILDLAIDLMMFGLAISLVGAAR
jgi:L-lysine exporter family protein LysE/ArgO